MYPFRSSGGAADRDRREATARVIAMQTITTAGLQRDCRTSYKGDRFPVRFRARAFDATFGCAPRKNGGKRPGTEEERSGDDANRARTTRGIANPQSRASVRCTHDGLDRQFEKSVIFQFSKVML